MGKADLHTHTVFSDGLFAPEIVMRKAKSKGISVISITDHDTISHIAEEKEIANQLGLEFIPGCEVSAYQNGKNYHILALNFDPDVKSFIEHFEEYEIERAKRAEIIAAKFTKLGMKISIDEIIEQSGNSPIGRPHIARAIVKAGYAQDQREVFSKYLYDNGPAYQAKSNLSVQKVVNLIHQAGGVAILAHPAYFFSIDELEKVVSEGIDGIEVNHPLHNDEMKKFYINFATSNKLLLSGGSDFHGFNDDEKNLGQSFIPSSYAEKIIDATKKIRSKPIFKHVWSKLFCFL
jgi:hypothetical protein